GQPVDEIVGRQSGIEVGRQVVDRADDRREGVVESGRERPRQIVLLVDARERGDQCDGRPKLADETPHELASTMTWWSYEKTSALRPTSSRSAGLPRSPVTGSAPKIRTSSTSSVPRTAWSAAYTSPERIDRPNGQPEPSGPPSVGWK